MKKIIIHIFIIIVLTTHCICGNSKINNLENTIKNERIFSSKPLKRYVVITYSDSSGFPNFLGDTSAMTVYHYNADGNVNNTEFYSNKNYLINRSTNWSKILDRYTHYIDNTSKIVSTIDSSRTPNIQASSKTLFSYTNFDSIKMIISFSYNFSKSDYDTINIKHYEYYSNNNLLHKLINTEFQNNQISNRYLYSYNYVDSITKEEFYIGDISQNNYRLSNEKITTYSNNNPIIDSTILIDTFGNKKTIGKSIKFYTENLIDSSYQYQLDTTSNQIKLMYIHYYRYTNQRLDTIFSIYTFDAIADTEIVRTMIYDNEGDIINTTYSSKYDNQTGIKPYLRLLYYYDDVYITGNISHIKNTISVYPNPTTNIINIKGLDELKTDFDVDVFDIHGKILYKENFKNIVSNIQINLSEITSISGIYFITIHNESLIKTFSVMLTKN